MNKTFLLCSFFFLFSCSHQRYSGSIKAIGVDQKEHQYLLSWHKTEMLGGFLNKTSDINLITCQSPELYTFNDDRNGINFKGDSSKMIPVHSKGKEVCGEIKNYKNIRNIKTGPIDVYIYCEPKYEIWSLVKPKALQAKSTPYSFYITKEETEEAIKCQ